MDSYKGNCHCGSFRFALDAPTITKATECPCSLCYQKGYLWNEVPEDAKFEVTRDDGKLDTYSSSAMEHKFCKACGTGVFGTHKSGPLQGKRLVNVRTILDLNPFKFSDPDVVTTDEAARPVPPITDPVKHVGSCHCGKTTVEILAPISEQEIKEDNCSSCVRSAWMGIYLPRKLVRYHGKENTTDYAATSRGWTRMPFCPTCGVHLFMDVRGPPREIIDRIPAERKAEVVAIVVKNMSTASINVRCFPEVKIADLTVERTDEGTEGYELKD